MELIQTINCGDDFSLLDFQLTEIMDSGLSGIRLNLNKYIQSSEIDSLSRLFEIISKYKERYKFLYDLPFPYNKTRIMEYKIMGNNIKKDEVYTLYFNQNDFIKAQENAILLSKSKNSYNNSKVVYYGDGQGAFEKVNETKDRVVLKAICDFQIYKRKSITYGKGSINDKIEPVLNMIGDVCSTLDYGCALSLVENEKDLSEFMDLTDKKIQLVSKIETNESINNLEEIVKRSDGIMLARGDLALLNPYYNLFQTLDDIIMMAKHYHKSVYMATDILQSLDCGRYIPSRSDIMDLSLACSWECDYVILGYHPNTEILKRKINAAEQICNGFKRGKYKA